MGGVPFAFIILIVILFVFCFFRFDDAKVRAKSSLSYFSFLSFDFDATGTLSCEKSTMPLLICRKQGYLEKTRLLGKNNAILEKTKAILFNDSYGHG